MVAGIKQTSSWNVVPGPESRVSCRNVSTASGTRFAVELTLGFRACWGLGQVTHPQCLRVFKLTSWGTDITYACLHKPMCEVGSPTR